MKVFKDILGYNHDELLSDAFELVPVMDVVYEVKTKMITKDTNVKVDTGANDSQEEGEEGSEAPATGGSTIVQVNNLIEAQRLTLTSFDDKKGYLLYLKGYMKEIENYLKENNPARVDTFKKNAQEYAKQIVANFSKYEFYQGENMDADGMVILKYYKDEDPINPYFVFWIDGLRAEKY
eukprot:gene1949-2385_t